MCRKTENYPATVIMKYLTSSAYAIIWWHVTTARSQLFVPDRHRILLLHLVSELAIEW